MQKFNQYNFTADIYNDLMKHVRYDLWASYLNKLLKKYSRPFPKLLEIGSGNGKLANYLIKKYPDYIISDLSVKMLKNIRDKSLNSIVLNITSIPFKCKFDAIIAAFDTINYLTTKSELKKAFNSVYTVLNDDGIFLFDISTEKNSLRPASAFERKGRVGSIIYVQKSNYDEVKRIHVNEFSFYKNNKIFAKEIHKQKIYLVEEIFELLDKSKLTVQSCYDFLSFNSFNKKSDRIQFVVRKK